MKKITNAEFIEAIEKWNATHDEKFINTIYDYCIQEGILTTFACIIPVKR